MTPQHVDRNGNEPIAEPSNGLAGVKHQTEVETARVYFRNVPLFDQNDHYDHTVMDADGRERSGRQGGAV